MNTQKYMQLIEEAGRYRLEDGIAYTLSGVLLEALECQDAFRHDDDDAIVDELGDVLHMSIRALMLLGSMPHVKAVVRPTDDFSIPVAIVQTAREITTLWNKSLYQAHTDQARHEANRKIAGKLYLMLALVSSTYVFVTHGIDKLLRVNNLEPYMSELARVNIQKLVERGLLPDSVLD